MQVNAVFFSCVIAEVLSKSQRKREKRQFYFFEMPLFGAITFQMYNDSVNCKNGFSFPIKFISRISYYMVEYEHSHKKVNDVSINRTKHARFRRDIMHGNVVLIGEAKIVRS